MTNEQTIISLDLLSNFTKRKYVICSFDLVENNQEKIKDFLVEINILLPYLFLIYIISRESHKIISKKFSRFILEFDDNFSLHFYDI